MPKILKNDYKEMFITVKTAIDEWNPYSLLPYAPADEFDGESRKVVARISKYSSVDEIASVVSSVFSEMFDPGDFPKNGCFEVAEAIKSNLEKHTTL